MANKYDTIMERLGACFDWTDPQFRPPSATEENLKEVEAKIGYSLPTDYREFLRNYGGAVMDALYPVLEEGVEKTEYVSIFHGITPDRLEIATIYRGVIDHYDSGNYPLQVYPGLHLIGVTENIDVMDWPPELLPIATSGGTDGIYLTLFGSHAGAIFYWRHVPFRNKQNFYLVAESFDEFMHLLRKDE